MRSSNNDLKRRLRQVMVPFFGAAAFAYFGYHAVQGDRGLVAWWKLRYELEKAESELSDVSAQRDALEHRVSLLRPESLDPDMLEERARMMLGFVNPDDRIVPLTEVPAPAKAKPAPRE